MIKKTVTYKDLDDNDVTEDFYFHLSGLELADLELSEVGGLAKRIEQIAGTQDMASVLKVFRLLVGASVGRRSDDNKVFLKSPEITASFMQSNAFEALFWELVKQPRKLADFIIGMVPAEMRENASKRMDEALTKVDLPKEDVNLNQPAEEPKAIEKPRKLDSYSTAELEAMPMEEFRSLMKTADMTNLPKHVLVIAMQRAIQNPQR